ncbi:MAG: glycosyl hydrolase family 25 [Paludibacteraceae bacterium]|nr:glycosyl hydrolase family 25 [Paludibacteraceae bacterium]
MPARSRRKKKITHPKSPRKGKSAGFWALIASLSLAVLLCGGFAYLYYLYEYDSKTWAEIVSMTNYNGIDVSHHNGIINWERVARDEKIQYVYIKATEGASFHDMLYRRNLTKSRKNGLKAGSYHYFSMHSTPEEQFENIRKHIKAEEQDLIPAIDVEHLKRYDPQEVRGRVLELARLMERHYGQKPLIYANVYDYRTYLAPELDEYPLFLAHYNLVASNVREKPYLLWQYSDRGAVNGIIGPVDFSRFHREADLRHLLLHKTSACP